MSEPKMTDEQMRALQDFLGIGNPDAEEQRLFLAGWNAGAAARQRLDVELCRAIEATVGVPERLTGGADLCADAIESTPMEDK